MSKEEKTRRTEQIMSLFECLEKTNNEVSRTNIKKMIVLLSDSIIDIETNRLAAAFNDFVEKPAISREELKQEGVLAVYDAIKNFDSEKNNAWCKYCSMYVHGLLVDFIEKNLYCIKYPYLMTDDIRLVRKWMERNFEKDGFIEQFPDYLERMWNDLKKDMGNKRYRMERAVAFVNFSTYKYSEEIKYSNAYSIGYLVSQPYDNPGEKIIEKENMETIDNYLDLFLTEEEKGAYYDFVFKERTIQDIVDSGLMSRDRFAHLRKILFNNRETLKQMQYA